MIIMGQMGDTSWIIYIGLGRSFERKRSTLIHRAISNDIRYQSKRECDKESKLLRSRVPKLPRPVPILPKSRDVLPCTVTCPLSVTKLPRSPIKGDQTLRWRTVRRWTLRRMTLRRRTVRRSFVENGGRYGGIT